jgi:hypothetical protein
MTVNLSLLGGAGWQFSDNNGSPLSGGLLYTYAAGTTTPQTTYTSVSGVTPNSNPVVLNAGGRVVGEIWLTQGQDYKFVLKNSADVTIGTYDNVPGVNDPADIYAALAAPTGSSLVGYLPAGTGAVATTVQAKLRQVVSVKDFGAVGDGVTDDFDAMLAAWNYAYPIGANLYFPCGTYLVVTNNFPFRNTQVPVTSLLDCNDMTIFGDGPSTILKTSSVLGADVLNLNGLKNFHVQNLQIQSVVTGTAAGSNGISITGGFDNLTFDNVRMKDLGYVDKTTFIDGGKAFTIQPSSEANPILMGSIKATNIFADGCVYGVGYEPDNDLALVQPVSIDVDIVVSNSRQGMVFSSGAATSTIAANSVSGVRIRMQSINNMQDAVISRCFGIDVDCQIIQTKTAAQLLLSYKGTAWTAVDTTSNVIGAVIEYAKNSKIVVYGNKKNCYYKASIGGAADGSSGLTSATDQCDIYLDITGTASSANVQYADAGGNIMNNTRLYCTTSTATTLPIQFYDPALDNTLTIGPDTRIQNIALTGQIGWTESDGRTVYHNKFLQSGVLSTKQIVGSGADLLNEQWLDHTSVAKVAWRNDGNLATTTKIAATAVATVNGTLAIYNLSGTLLGYVPIYTTFTP